ncbi:peptidylprolyl isomerase [Govanella unica]|uniref:Peptidyl-prolyl cis-trans isomerase n=1 Tax=Govanella unica TaxID=2975056 RepID=A0A9X3TVR0_9PROT|nr:peptidylprolyl isomerase [Govania unica]MDA5192673.1 peptidylprolyl isomerase [Govania unica]
MDQKSHYLPSLSSTVKIMGIFSLMTASSLFGPTTGNASPGPAAIALKIETSAGDIGLELYGTAAPITVCNFLRYVVTGHYDGGQFFRTVLSSRRSANPIPINVIQAAGRDQSGPDLFAPIPLERTSLTGLHHRSGTLSMARLGPDTATSSFFITLEDTKDLDFGGRRNPDGQGFAAFGRVTSGMEVVTHIHQASSQDETLTPPIKISRIQWLQPLTPAKLKTAVPGCQWPLPDAN